MPRPATTPGRHPSALGVVVAAVVAALVLAQPAGRDLVGATGRSEAVVPGASSTVDLPGGAQLVVDRPAGAGLRPVLLHVPGGGWERLDETDVGAAFGHDDAAAAGWAVATLRYRVADGTSGVTVADQAADVDAALSWLRSAGTTLSLGSRIVGIGHSAGAHLLALTTARAPRERQPSAVVLVAGVYDFEPDVVAAPMLAPVLAGALGCPPVRCGGPDVRPATFADPWDIPVTIIHGTADPVVPVAGAVRHADALVAAGASVTLRLVDGGGHLDGALAAAVREAVRAATASAA